MWQVIPRARRHSEGCRCPCGFHTWYASASACWYDGLGNAWTDGSLSDCKTSYPPCLQCRQSDSQEKNPCRWNTPHSGTFLYISYADIFKGFTVAVWVGSSGPALCSLGDGEKDVPDVVSGTWLFLSRKQFIDILSRQSDKQTFVFVVLLIKFILILDTVCPVLGYELFGQFPVFVYQFFLCKRTCTFFDYA